ncbi:ATP-binding protein [Candidatus Entotheonella palauensis]|uniref:ATP-binding protein n=1 Tax=Candidatus Entotheonella palauensis TaxID=93172 RepID=UPI0015C452DE|nr:ATP-binding protein [Candidatus Entotheonella palauensis]
MQLSRFHPSLRQVVAVIFFLFATVTAVAIGVLWTHSAWDREIQTVQDQHLQLASHLAEALSRYAEDTEAVFQLAVANLVKHQPVREIDILLERLHFKHICIVNGRGEVEQVVSPNTNLRIERIPETLLAKLQTGNQANSVPLSNVLPDRKGEPTLYLWYTINPRQYALGALKTTYFTQLQKAISFGQSGHAAIVDRSGRIIAHPLEQWQAEMKDISQLDPIRRMIAGETGVSWFYSPALKADMVAGFTTVAKTGWGVMVPQPLSELQAHVGEVKRIVWWVVGLILLASVIVGWLLSKWLALNLQRLGDVAERFAKGRYDTRAGNQDTFQMREVATLSAQFDRMANDVVKSWQGQRESEERFREFAQIAADWFWETDMDQVFTYMSPMPQTGRHLEAETYIGHPRSDFVCYDPEGHITRLIQDHMDREAPFDDVAITIQGYDGKPIHVVIAGRPMRNADGEVIGYRGVVRDVTERLQIEALRREVQEVEETRQAQKMEAIGVLAGGIAHDFNNTLGVILGYAELTQPMVPENGPAWQNLQQIYNAGERAKHIVEQILTFSRKSDPERKPVYLHEVVGEALKLLRASLPTTIEIYQEAPSDVRDVVLADRTQIHQVLMNLCANAEHAMRDAGGVLEVRIDVVEVDETLMATDPSAELRPGPHVRLRIRDTGHGMTAEVVERIFEPYFTTKKVSEGTGMGLSVVHGIIASHGGAITVASRPEVGTTFEIYLPQIDAEIEDQLVGDGELPLGNKESILFVDDEEVLTLLMQEMLIQLGYDVEVRTSSLEALAAFRAEPERFDLVITDQTMPLMPGDVLAQELRAIRPEIPLILCTGHSHTMDAETAAAKGFDAFCMKPLVMHDLGVVIRRVLSRRAARVK